MNAVLSAAGGWAVAVAIAAPIIILFWWARRNAPVGEYEMDYSVGRRSRPAADGYAAMPAPALHGAADAPVLANPAVLAPPNEAAVPPASTVNLPLAAGAPLPAEPASVLTAEPTPVKVLEPPAAAVAPAAISPAPVAAVPSIGPETPKPAPAVPVARATPAPVPAKAPEPKPKPQPVAAPVPAAAPAPAVMEKPAPAPTPKPEPAPAPVEAPAPTATAAATEPAGDSDDFLRLYGPDAAAITALNAAGILTYRQLAGASIDSLKEILSAAGDAGVDPSTWPQQGRFAAGGKWKQLDARFKK